MPREANAGPGPLSKHLCIMYIATPALRSSVRESVREPVRLVFGKVYIEEEMLGIVLTAQSIRKAILMM